MVGPLAIDTYLPAFHTIGRDFGVSLVLVQQTLSVYLFAFSFMVLFYGTLSDSFGRRPVILTALILYTAASFGAAFAPGFGWFMLFRLVQGLAGGAGTVIGRAVVRDRASGVDAARMLSYMLMVFSIAPAVAPIFGGWLDVAFGWRSIFIFLGLFALTMLGICYRALPETLATESRQHFKIRPIVANYWKVLRHRQFLLLALAPAFSSIGFALYLGSSANFVMNILHLPETSFGWLCIPLISGTMVGAMITSRVASRFRPVALVEAGYVLMVLAALANVAYCYRFVPSVPAAILPLVFYTIGRGISFPSITVLGLDLFPHNRGLASSLQSFAQMLAFAVIAGVAAPLLYDSALKLSYGMLGGVILSLIFWIAGHQSAITKLLKSEAATTTDGSVRQTTD